jgi:hypothetical protein
LGRLVSFFDFPAEHGKHLRTTNVIEIFSRLWSALTKGAGSRTKGLPIAFKLLDMAQQRGRRLDCVGFLPLIRTGVTFIDESQKPAGQPNQPQRQAKPPESCATIHNILTIALDLGISSNCLDCEQRTKIVKFQSGEGRWSKS